MRNQRTLLSILLSSLLLPPGIYLTEAGSSHPLRVTAIWIFLFFSSLTIVVFFLIKRHKQYHHRVCNLQKELQTVRHRLKKAEEAIANQTTAEPLVLTNLSTSDDENAFQLTFRQQYPGFVRRLRMLAPDLSSGEERLCMMIKLCMSTREVAQTLNIDLKSVHTARARLKRKLPLEGETAMDNWIREIE